MQPRWPRWWRCRCLSWRVARRRLCAGAPEAHDMRSIGALNSWQQDQQDQSQHSHVQQLSAESACPGPAGVCLGWLLQFLIESNST